MEKILITGVGGFIGFHTAKKLLVKGKHIIGIDNMNNSYDTALKEYRLSKLKHFTNFIFYKQDIANLEDINNLDMLDTLPDIQKANKLLNWKPEIDLDEGISNTINWHIENRELVNSIIL